MSSTNTRDHTNNADDSGVDSHLPSAVNTTYDWANVEPTTAVVETVAAVTNTKPTDLDVLHDVVDTSALNSFLTSNQDDDSDDLRVSFDYQGCTVVARQTGRISVYPVDA